MNKFKRDLLLRANAYSHAIYESMWKLVKINVRWRWSGNRFLTFSIPIKANRYLETGMEALGTSEPIRLAAFCQCVTLPRRKAGFFSCCAAMLQQVVAAWVARKIRDRLFKGRHLHLFPWNSSLASNTWNLALLSLETKRKKGSDEFLKGKEKPVAACKCGGRFFYVCPERSFQHVINLNKTSSRHTVAAVNE